MKKLFNDILLPAMMKFSEIKAIKSMKDGLVITMPFTIIGSIFLIIANFPYAPIANWLSTNGWTDQLNVATGATFDLMAIFAVAALANQWVKDDGYDGMPAAFFAIAAFVITLRPSVDVMQDGQVVGKATNVINMAWTGSKGMFAALIIGMLVGWTYSWFLRKNIKINLPPQVPANISNAFTSIIPGLSIITGALIIHIIFDKAFDSTLIEEIYRIIQIPLQSLTDSFGGLVIFIVLMCGFWAFGIHGPLIVNGIMGPVLLANTLDNASLSQQGAEILQQQGHIFTQPLIDQFVNVTGTGMTIGLVVFMAFFAKSQQFKSLGKLGGVPAIFNINEPLLFGTPIVLNPLLIPPFILTPLISGSLTYFMIKIGVLPMLTGIQVPWTTPPIISGFIIGGWKFMVWQILMLLLSVIIYFPFAKIADKKAYDLENS